MQKHHKKNSSKKWMAFWHAKGLYLILGIGILAAAVGSGISVHNGLNEIEKNNAEIVSAQKKTSGELPAEQHVSGQRKPSVSSAPSAGSSSSPSRLSGSGQETDSSEELQGSEPLLYILPAAGQMGTGFSGDDLVYYPVLKVWQVHQGMDICAGKGTPVKAPADGTVSKVFEDAVWGVTVRIRHPDGMTSQICGLNHRLNVKEGDRVSVGDRLGKVEGVPAERTKCGIHFTLQNADGVYEDPMNYVRTGMEESR